MEKACIRLLGATLKSLIISSSHPLARELHFHIVLLGAKILNNSTTLDIASKWRLKDQVLSVGLSWFANPPRWSFGGNRLQVKAETHLLADVANALHYIRDVGIQQHPSRASLGSKQVLLETLVASEQTRLMVWLFPLDHGTRHHFAAGQGKQPPSEVSASHQFCSFLRSRYQDTIVALLPTAWTESAALAISLTQRFSSPRVSESVRQMVLAHPRKALNEAAALHIMLGSSLPNDVSSQLKVRSSQLVDENNVDFCLVPIVLGTSESHHRGHILSASLCKSPMYHTIRGPNAGESFDRCHFLLRTADRASFAIRCPRLCRDVHH